MSTYPFYFKDEHSNKHGISPELFYSEGYRMVHHEVDGNNSQMLSGEQNSSNYPEHHFTLYTNALVLAWLVLMPQDRRIAKLKTRYYCNEVDLKLSEKIHDYIEQFAGKKGFREIIIHASPSGVGFYTCMGFHNESACLQVSGAVTYVMKKEI